MKNEHPIKSGWRGNLNGYIEQTKSEVRVSKISLELDSDTAWALCNMLTDAQLKAAICIEQNQSLALSNLGAALGRLIDHSAANNGGRRVIK